jgi:hypothetical protein
MKIAFSCVVDAHAKFEWQGIFWANSILRNVGCLPEDVFIHCLPNVTTKFRESIKYLNINIVDVLPFEGGHAYCNKIQQFYSGVFAAHDKVVFSDADIFFLCPPQLSSYAMKFILNWIKLVVVFWGLLLASQAKSFLGGRGRFCCQVTIGVLS